MKILQFTNFYPPPLAGTERYVTDLTENLAKRGHQVRVVYTQIAYRKERAAMKFEPINGATLTYIPDRFTFFKVYQEIKKFKPDIIHTHYLKTGFRAAIIGSMLNIPVVCSIHLADENTKPLIRKIATRVFGPIFRKVKYIAVSKEIEESVKEDVHGANVSIIPCWTWNSEALKSANSEKFRNKFPPKSKIIFTISRIVEEKGIRQLILAAKEVAQKREDCYFVVAGDGKMLEEYKSLVKSLGIEKHFIFLGRISNEELLDAYKGCDVIVIPSLMDCLFSLTESLVTNKPIIVNSVRCATEMIEDKKSGLLVNARNPEEISNAILNILSDKQLYNKVVNGASIEGKKYLPDICIGKIEELYKEVLPERTIKHYMNA